MSENIPRLQQRYIEKAIPALVKEFEFKNSMEVPRLTKVTLNMGLGEAVQNGKIIEVAATELAAQSPESIEFGKVSNPLVRDLGVPEDQSFKVHEI